MRPTYFVTGTDTDAGKTLVSSALLSAVSNRGLSTLGLKPVSAGCVLDEGVLRNSDALSLMQYSSIKLSYEQVNPIAFEPPIAPHIAAELAGRKISLDRLVGLCKGALMRSYDFGLVEGAGGWRVPINDRETLADLATALNLPVILVVGMKLGCLSHALLTAEAIRRDGRPLVGWVANQIDPNMAEREQNLESLKRRIPAPFLGFIPFMDKVRIDYAAEQLDIDQLI